ncbi:hypothetical protein ACH3XW_5090 [Acanthocheilonema viteae]
MRECKGRNQKMHENITRKVEQLMADMTRQLISNASNEEDVEVEVKMLFGKLVGSPKNASSRNSINKNLCPMRRIFGCFDATVTATGNPEASSANHRRSITSHYSSPSQQITTEDETSINEESEKKRGSARKHRSRLLHSVDL